MVGVRVAAVSEKSNLRWNKCRDEYWGRRRIVDGVCNGIVTDAEVEVVLEENKVN